MIIFCLIQLIGGILLAAAHYGSICIGAEIDYNVAHARGLFIVLGDNNCFLFSVVHLALAPESFAAMRSRCVRILNIINCWIDSVDIWLLMLVKW
jgi:hypothetical protein